MDVDGSAPIGRRGLLLGSAATLVATAGCPWPGNAQAPHPSPAAAAADHKPGSSPNSTLVLRSDIACTGTNPNFAFDTKPWRKYVSVNLGTTIVGNDTVNRAVRAGVLVVDDWQFQAGPHQGKTATLAIATTTTNELYCFSEVSLHHDADVHVPLWQTFLGVTPSMRNSMKLPAPMGVCGTPVIDLPNRRMFVVALWDDASHVGHYSVFSVSLDTGAILASQELVDPGVQGQPTFDPDVLYQRCAANLVAGWIWVGFAGFLYKDRGPYFGWLVAINSEDLTQQHYQCTISANSNQRYGIYDGGLWGIASVAGAPDGSVYALTANATQVSPSDTKGLHPGRGLKQFGENYWASVPDTGPGSIGDYFQAMLRLGVPQPAQGAAVPVVDWFQGTFTQNENANDADFAGSSTMLLPPINGRQLLVFLPKDGYLYFLDAQHLGHYSLPLSRTDFGAPDTKTAVAYVHTPEGRDILIIGSNTTGSCGGFVAFELDATPQIPTLRKLWQSSAELRDAFAAPIILANPVTDPNDPPTPFGLTFVIDGQLAPENYLENCALRAYQVVSGEVVYDSTVNGDIDETVPHFAPLTSGGKSVFVPTSVGFMGFAQI
jgi:hypothetical protein